MDKGSAKARLRSDPGPSRRRGCPAQSSACGALRSPAAHGVSRAALPGASSGARGTTRERARVHAGGGARGLATERASRARRPPRTTPLARASVADSRASRRVDAMEEAFRRVPYEGACHHCGKMGHIARACPKPRVCAKCGMKGHIEAHCGATQTSAKEALAARRARVVCLRCGRKGHVRETCPVNNFRCRICGQNHRVVDCPSNGATVHNMIRAKRQESRAFAAAKAAAARGDAAAERKRRREGAFASPDAGAAVSNANAPRLGDAASEKKRRKTTTGGVFDGARIRVVSGGCAGGGGGKVRGEAERGSTAEGGGDGGAGAPADAGGGGGGDEGLGALEGLMATYDSEGEE